MKSKTEKIEIHHEIEYGLQQGIHYREGEILNLKHFNSKQDREIGRLMDHLVEKEEDINDLKVDHYKVVETLVSRINELEYELKIRNVPVLKESLIKAGRLALAQEAEIDRLNARIDTMLETTSDDQENVQGDQIDRYVLLSDNDPHKIELADSILHEFGIDKMAEYEDLIANGEIDLKCIDRRKGKVVRSSVEGTKDGQGKGISW